MLIVITGLLMKKQWKFDSEKIMISLDGAINKRLYNENNPFYNSVLVVDF